MKRKTRIPSIKAIKKIDDVLKNLKNGADVFKVLSALATLRGDFCVEDLS